jgi:hypothetical protein
MPWKDVHHFAWGFSPAFLSNLLTMVQHFGTEEIQYKDITLQFRPQGPRDNDIFWLLQW